MVTSGHIWSQSTCEISLSVLFWPAVTLRLDVLKSLGGFTPQGVCLPSRRQDTSWARQAKSKKIKHLTMDCLIGQPIDGKNLTD